MAISQVGNTLGQRRRTLNTLGLITGIILVAGFGLDVAALSLRPTLSSIEWRMGFMQQLGERCIILLFGVFLFSYGLQSKVSSIKLKYIAMGCCGLGLCISLSGFFYLQDSYRFQSLALENLINQQQSIVQQIRQFTASQLESDSAPTVDPSQKSQAIALLQERTQTLAQRTKIRLQKTATRTFCNLLLVGTGLVALGQIMLKSKRLDALTNNSDFNPDPSP